MTLLKPHNIGTHLKCIETSFQVVSLFLKSIHFWVSYITFWNFLKIPSVSKGSKCATKLRMLRYIERYAIIITMNIITSLTQEKTFP
jgi:hypothetical protein